MGSNDSTERSAGLKSKFAVASKSPASSKFSAASISASPPILGTPRVDDDVNEFVSSPLPSKSSSTGKLSVRVRKSTIASSLPEKSASERSKFATAGFCIKSGSLEISWAKPETETHSPESEPEKVTLRIRKLGICALN